MYFRFKYIRNKKNKDEHLSVTGLCFFVSTVVETPSGAHSSLHLTQHVCVHSVIDKLKAYQYLLQIYRILYFVINYES